MPVGRLAQVTSCGCSCDNRVLEVGGHRCLVLLGLLPPMSARGDGHPSRMLLGWGMGQSMVMAWHILSVVWAAGHPSWGTILDKAAYCWGI